MKGTESVRIEIKLRRELSDAEWAVCSVEGEVNATGVKW